MTESCQALAPYLEPDELEEAEAHLPGCARCAEEQALDGWVGQRLQAEAAETPQLPAALRARLVARAGEELGERPSASASAAAVDPSAQAKVRLHCTYCHDVLGASPIYCADCIAPHHTECFEAHGQCAAPGCAGARFVDPQGPVQTVAPASPASPSRWRFLAERRHLRWVGAAASLAWIALGIGGAAYWKHERRVHEQFRRATNLAKQGLALQREGAELERRLVELDAEAQRLRDRALAERVDRQLWEAVMRALGGGLPQANHTLLELDSDQDGAPRADALFDALEAKKTWVLQMELKRLGAGSLRLELSLAKAIEVHGEVAGTRKRIAAEVADLVEALRRRGLEPRSEVGLAMEIYDLAPDAVVDTGTRDGLHAVVVPVTIEVQTPPGWAEKTGGRR